MVDTCKKEEFNCWQNRHFLLKKRTVCGPQSEEAGSERQTYKKFRFFCIGDIKATQIPLNELIFPVRNLYRQ